MIQYVIAENPDDRVINRAASILVDGGIVVLPTETSWVFAASLMSKKGVEILYRIKGVERRHHLSILCSSISQASQFAIISNSVYRLMNKVVPGPFTFILHPTRDIPKSIRDYRKQKEIGIKIPNSFLCQRLIQACHHPIITASLDKEMLGGDGDVSTIYSYQIEDSFGFDVQMILDPGEFDLPAEGGSIIDFTSEDELPVIVREGVGDISIFM